MTDPNPTDAELLAEMGTDALKWAEEFANRWDTAPADIDLAEFALGWFANAIMAGYDAVLRARDIELAEIRIAWAALYEALPESVWDGYEYHIHKLNDALASVSPLAGTEEP